MQLANIAARLMKPFANSGNKAAIPQTGTDPVRASYETGFTPLNMTPIAAGGVPPSGRDMNGILYDLSNAMMWQQAMGILPYDATVSYPNGALVVYGGMLWKCLADDTLNVTPVNGAKWTSDIHTGYVKKTGDTITGTLTAPTAPAGTNTTQIATTAFVQAAQSAGLGSTSPLMDGAEAAGTATKSAREDHRHPTDTTRAPLWSPAFTGTPTAPTAPAGSNSTQIATTAFVKAEVAFAALVGSVQYFAFSYAPAGWLKANGAEISRTIYAALFAAIGTTYGAGNGSTTFNLPDLRGEFIRGWDEGRGADPWRVFGSWQGGQNQWHQHPGTTSTSDEHSHAVSIPSKPSGGGAGPMAMVDGAWHITGYQTYNTNAAGSHTHTFTTSGEGGSEARPRNVALLMCIKY